MEAQDKTSTAVLKSYGLMTTKPSFLGDRGTQLVEYRFGRVDADHSSLIWAVAVVTQPVSAHGDGSSDTSSTLEEKYQGTNPIVFAFKANQIMFDESNQCWTAGNSDDEVARQLAMGGLKPNVFSRLADKIGHMFHRH